MIRQEQTVAKSTGKKKKKGRKGKGNLRQNADIAPPASPS